MKKMLNRVTVTGADDVNNDLLDKVTSDGINAVPLFDISGGRGIVPKEWPKQKGYCGYAGGLSPDNLQEQLEKIEKVVDDVPIWIDAETHLRSPDNSILDLDKVRSFLEIARPWVI